MFVRKMDSMLNICQKVFHPLFRKKEYRFQVHGQLKGSMESQFYDKTLFNKKLLAGTGQTQYVCSLFP